MLSIPKYPCNNCSNIDIVGCMGCTTLGTYEKAIQKIANSYGCDIANKVDNIAKAEATLEQQKRYIEIEKRMLKKQLEDWIGL